MSKDSTKSKALTPEDRVTSGTDLPASR
jgi:hypothetical protein